ncbi:UNVERIFIED_CONTAM: Reactive Intermediate Deaminase A, chloroplastic [Sesamum latifolium]|uniref:Reactive Intermediate Deaminase A, chloroplastic n=1 Tax=Sesamum latifolium TaxID=2727402 RepID=A0AAW2TQY0_9LAMI
MTWCAAARSFRIPAIDLGALRIRAPLAVGVGCLSLAGANLRRAARSPGFASVSISTDASAARLQYLLQIVYTFCILDDSLIVHYAHDAWFVLPLTLGIKEAVQTDKAPAALGHILKLLKQTICFLSLGFLDLFRRLADLKDFKKVNEIYAKYFPAPAPARSTYQVAALPMDARIEIECIAALPQ